MALVASRLYQKLKRSMGVFGLIIRTAATSVLTADPSVSAGSGVPSEAEPNGSVFLRTGGTAGASLYQRVGGAWKAFADQTAYAATDAKVTAIVAENTDVAIPMDFIGAYNVVSGTWTATRPLAAAYRLRRTAAAAIEVVALRSFPRQRTSASKGTKVTGFRLVYNVGTADVNDVTVSGAFTIAPATGNAIAAATSFGAVTYDAAHDTTAERKAVGAHTMVGTFATPVYLNSDALAVELLVTVDGTATGVFDIIGVELLCAETLVDAA